MMENHTIPSPYYRLSVKAKLMDGDKVLLVKEDDKDWDLPGGGVEHSETILAALKRELFEETGLKNFSILGEPKVVKMIDPSCGRPLLFLVYEIVADSTAVKNGTFFPKDNLPEDVVSYSEGYKELIGR